MQTRSETGTPPTAGDRGNSEMLLTAKEITKSFSGVPALRDGRLNLHEGSIHALCGGNGARGIPAVHYMIAAAGGATIRCAPYATFGTEELSRGAVDALEGRLACLLANHGLIACGPSLRKALWLANEVEVLAKQYYLSLQLGEPIVLSDEEMTTVIQKFKTGYGPKGKV